jgi:hypothetical protein
LVEELETETPVPLKAMRLPSPGASPPTTVFDASESWMPCEGFGRGASPAAFVPM